MRKIPTLFRRDPDDLRRVLPEWAPGCEWVSAGEGTATRKYDGTCVLIRRDGLAVHAFARREVKPGKEPPADFVEVDHDPVTDKRVGWEPAEQSGFAKLIYEAVNNALWDDHLLPGTYELVGPKVNRNPEGYDRHVLVMHDQAEVLDLEPPPADPVVAHELLGELLLGLTYEGIVWHHPDGRMAKLKGRDFR